MIWLKPLLISLWLLSLPALLPAANHPATEEHTLGQPTERVIAGEQLLGQTQNGIMQFFAVPYAQPPVDALRWRAPQAPKPRPGPQDARQFSPACIQNSRQTDWYRQVIKAFEQDPDLAPVPTGFSEDCLYLNIWAPARPAPEPMPVVIFVHGGNNDAGWSYEPNLHGDAFARQEVVYVSINYRLGIFGFMAHPWLSAESGHQASGEYGLLDIIAALRWVQQNIGSVGGDKNNVTLMGESQGSANIGDLLSSPMTQGLFHNVIAQSSGYEINYQDNLANEEAFGEEFVKGLGVSSLEALRKLPAPDLLNSAVKYYQSSYDNLEKAYFYGLSGGQIRQHPLSQLYAEGQLNPVNFLTGFNADELSSWGKISRDVDQFIDQYFVPEGHDQVRAMLAELPSDQARIRRLIEVQMYKCPVQYQAAAFASQNPGNTFVYYFNRVRPGPGGARQGAYHGAELPYVFNTHDDWLPVEDKDIELSKAMLTYWVNFARTGNPNGNGLPAWPPYRKGEQNVMQLGDQIEPVNAPDQGFCALLKPPQPA